MLHSALIDDSDAFVVKMLDRMHNDEVKDVVQHDTLIRKYAAALRVESLGSEKDKKVNDVHRVSQCCRSLARLLMHCKEKCSPRLIDTLISPEHFDLVVSTTKMMSIEKKETAISLGRYMGNILAHVIQVKTGYGLRNNDNNKCEQAENFHRVVRRYKQFR